MKLKFLRSGHIKTSFREFTLGNWALIGVLKQVKMTEIVNVIVSAIWLFRLNLKSGYLHENRV